ncbi:hypothetical protein CDAR_249071 [Caerostris darwini]|uniref:Uncharacterized protein n=1 Tax=Caerostris darwini TaxID=1538125 RepID=A0AAV4RVU7_9ARAC|nr:hypothetical protein CDAR_249071 [Caerostris darwini]
MIGLSNGSSAFPNGQPPNKCSIVKSYRSKTYHSLVGFAPNRINPRNPGGLLFTFLTALLLFRSLFSNPALTTEPNKIKQTKCAASSEPFRISALCERTSSLILLFESMEEFHG